MKMRYLIDANIFLHTALEQSNSSACKKFLDKVSEGEIEAFSTIFHTDAAAIVMENRGLRKSDIGEYYFEIYRSEGLRIVNLGFKARMNALADNNHSGLDDGLMIQAMKQLDIDKIVTYDKDFDEEKRIVPEEIMSDF